MFKYKTYQSSPDVLDRKASWREELTCDVAIIGGGGAGMSLLWSLAETGYMEQHKVVLIEPEPKDSHDRTWCFWAREDDPWIERLRPCISHEWTEAKAEGRLDELKPYSYFQVRSADFYALVKNRLSNISNFHWIQEAVKEPLDIKSGQISLKQIDVLAQKIFDSRVQISGPSAPQVELWQSFLGWRIQTDQAHFSPHQMELMNFDVDQKGETQFLYFLPTAKDEMLIELTRFGREKIDRDWAAEHLRDHLEKAVGSYDILEEETGAIPMSQSLDNPERHHPEQARHIPIGTAAGAVKPTTGYAFYQMLEHGAELAQAIKSDSLLPTVYRPSRYRFYDRLLLDILKEEPEQGRPIFKQLFRRVKTPAVFRFLGENMRLKEEVPLLLSLPIRPFLRALDRQYAGGCVQSFLSVLNIKNGKKNFVIWLAFLLLGLQLISPQATQWLALPLLVGGLVFPGIPHGAVDHVLDGAAPTATRQWIRFIGMYIGIMFAIVALWWVSSLVGLLFFLAYSAWHFGETDLKHWQAYAPGRVWVYGLSILGFILFSHPVELADYLNAMGLPLIDFQSYGPLLLIFSAGMLFPAQKISAERLSSYILTLSVVVIGVALPLLLAFALYFVGLHSWRAWRHLRSGLQMTDRQLLRAAAPFSLGAYLFIFGFMALIYFQWLPFQGIPAAIFLFLAAVSAPHIWMMHGFYRK